MNDGYPIDLELKPNANWTDALSPDVALDEDGNAICVFAKFNKNERRIFARYWNGTKWSWMNEGKPIDSGPDSPPERAGYNFLSDCKVKLTKAALKSIAHLTLSMLCQGYGM